MGIIGRMIEEGEWAHTADLYSMWFGVIGSGYIMPVGSRCAATLSGTNEVTISDGKVSFGNAGEMEYSGTTLTPNVGSEFSRYDLVYLVNNSGSVAAEVSKGSDLKLPSMTMPPDKEIVPIAVLFWDENQEIAELKDVRVVVDAEHSHSPGDGLLLDRYNAEMNVDADESTITTQNYNVEVDEVKIPSDLLHEGLFLENDRVMNVKTGVGLGIEEVTNDEGSVIEELLVMDPSTAAGDGLAAPSGNLDAEAGNGVELVSDRVTVNDGDGVILRGTTPDRQIDLYRQDYGGLYFENGSVIIQADDFDGAGLSGSNEKLNVRAGYGITVGTDVNLDVGSGLTIGTQLNVDRETGGGIELDADNKLYAEAKSEIGGPGLTVSNGVVSVDPGNGIQLTADATEVDLESDGGLQITNGQIEAVTGNGTKLGTDYGRLQIDPADIAGIGLKADSESLAIDVDAGLQITSDAVAVDMGSGVTTDSGELTVVPTELVDQDTLVVNSGSICLNEKPNFFELLADETFTLSPGGAHVITVADVFPLVSINAVGQTSTNHGEYEWYWQEHSEENGGKQEIVIEYPSGNYSEDINLRARIYHIKWVEWME